MHIRVPTQKELLYLQNKGRKRIFEMSAVRSSAEKKSRDPRLYVGFPFKNELPRDKLPRTECERPMMKIKNSPFILYQTNFSTHKRLCKNS